MPPPPRTRSIGGATSSRTASSSNSSSTTVRSSELEKLLNSWGGASAGSEYNAEAMIDQLLANTWGDAPSSMRRGSLKNVGGTTSAATASATASRTESFTQQTASMNELETVLSDSIDRLLRHRAVISDRIAALEKDNQKVAAKFQDGLHNPELLLTQICLQMEDLEERFTKVSSTAVVIGDKLATLDHERTRVLDTDEMMEALLALNEPTTSKQVMRSNNKLVSILQDKTQLHEASKVIKKMLIFSTELSSSVTSFAVTEIERLSQTIENDLLTEFSDAQEKNQIKLMRKCADSLVEYNDKDKVADRFVWNVLKDKLASVTSSNGRGDRDRDSLNPIQDLEFLFSTIYGICQDQFEVISSVFPSATCTAIRELLVERLFNDPAFGIFSYLDQLLNNNTTTTTRGSISGSVNPEYVRLLCAAYERTCTLALQIEQLELPASAAPQPTRGLPPAATGAAAAFSPLKEATELEVSSTTNTTTGDCDRMKAFLALQLHSLFGSHRQKYVKIELELEQNQLKQIFMEIKFPQAVVAIKPPKTTSASSSKNATTANSSSKPPLAPAATGGGAATGGAGGAGGGSSSSTSSTNVFAPSTQNTSSSNLEKEISMANTAVIATTTESATQLFYETLWSIASDDELLFQFSNCLQDALSRCEIILKDSEMRGELVTKLFGSFMACVADDFVAKLVAMANDLLQEPMVSSQSGNQFFTLLELLLRRIDFIDDQFDSLIAPRQNESPTQLTICYESKRKCMEKLERKIAMGLQQLLVVVDKTLSQILTSTQEKTDFMGSTSDTNLSLSCSKAAKKCVDFLQPLVALVHQVLMAENKDQFILALCVVFKDLYLAHLLKFRFDPDGAIMVLRDVNAYRHVFSSSSSSSSSTTTTTTSTSALVAVDDVFDFLHEVANLFAMPPENVGSFIRDGKLATLSKQSVVDILKRRWDYKTYGDKMQLQL